MLIKTEIFWMSFQTTFLTKRGPAGSQPGSQVPAGSQGAGEASAGKWGKKGLLLH